MAYSLRLDIAQKPLAQEIGSSPLLLSALSHRNVFGVVTNCSLDQSLRVYGLISNCVFVFSCALLGRR